MLASMAAGASARVRAMELGLAFCSKDVDAYRAKTDVASPPPLCSGFPYSGSFAGRNIEKLYALGGLEGSLEAAVRASFQDSAVKHVLVSSGFYVLHNHGGNDGQRPGIAAGSCETDGPLGALALVRAFARRGVHVSLYCEPHNGPVLRTGYEAMLRYFDAEVPALAARLRSHTRCLPDATDGAAEAPGSDFAAAYAKLFPEDPSPQCGSLRSRAVRCSFELGKALTAAWADGLPGHVDALFAIERLSAPYRNIRGADISAHTEPIDALWPEATPEAGSEAHAAIAAFATEHGLPPTAALRELALVAEDAVSFGIGDGGNEVGMGKITCRDDVGALSPGGEFAPIRVNGAYRTCDHLLLGTVSNWAGTAFEAAAHVLFDRDALEYDASLHAVAVEATILDAIMAPPTCSVDGKYHEQPRSVDGMAWEPYHREFYEQLWGLAVAGPDEAEDQSP